MKSIKILIFVIFICNTLLFALSNDMLADKYLIAAKKYIKTKEYTKAVSNFEKIFDLGIKVPNDIYYFYAKTLKNNNELKKSFKFFNLYVEKTGRSSQHYQETLGFMVEIEDTIEENKKAEKRRIKANYKGVKGSYTYNGKKGIVYKKRDDNGDGTDIYYFPNSKDIRKLAHYKNNKKDGSYTIYQSNRKVHTKGNYKNGKEEGKWKIYYTSGNLMLEYFYENGVLIREKEF